MPKIVLNGAVFKGKDCYFKKMTKGIRPDRHFAYCFTFNRFHEHGL